MGSAADAYEAIKYTGTGVTDTTWTVTAPTQLGQYEFRFFLNNDYSLQFGTSAAVTVEAAPEPDPPALTVDTTTATPGDSVTVTLTNGAGGSLDFLTLAKVGSAPSSYESIQYLGAGATDTTWTVNMPADLDDYEFRLFLDNDFNQQAATSPAVTVAADPDPDPTTPNLSVSTTTAAPGDSVTVTLTNGAGGALDVLTLAKVGSAPSSYESIQFVGSGITDTTWTVNMPADPDDYEFRLFLNNDFNQLAATSPAVTVAPQAPSPTLTPSTTTANPGDTVTVTLANGLGGTLDVMTLAKVGSAPSSYESIQFVGSGVTDTTWTVTMPADPDDYEFRLFENNDFNQQIAVSAAVTVEPAPEPEPDPATLTVSATTAAPGEQVTVTLANGPGGSLDFLTFAAVGSAASSYESINYIGAGVTDYDLDRHCAS